MTDDPITTPDDPQARAAEAEQTADALRAQLERRNDELALAEAQRDEAQMQMSVAETQSRIEKVLLGTGVIDLETATLLLKKRMDFSEDLTGDQIRNGIQTLLGDKPFLSGPKPAALSMPGATTSPRQAPAGGDALLRAAKKAAQTGNRKDIAEYLRLRRRGRGGGISNIEY